MGFKRIDPKRNRPTSARARQAIRVVFSPIKRSKVGGYILTMYIGKDIADKLNLKAGDKVAVSYDEDNNRKLLIEQDHVGYTLANISGKTSPSYRILLQWQLFAPNQEDTKLREVEYEYFNDNKAIIVTL